MYPNRFEYFRPSTVQEALSLLSAHGDEAKVMAGGQSLLSMMKLRLASPQVVIDLGGIGDLNFIREEGDKIVIGALTTYFEIRESKLLQSKCNLLPQTATVVGDVQVRNRGTIGGSLAHADPAGDMPAAIMALQAELKVVGPGGERWVKAEDFFLTMMTTILGENDILTEIRVPVLKGQRIIYMKNAPRPSDFAIVGIAVCLKLGPDDLCEEISIGVTGVGDKAYRPLEVENALRGKKLEPGMIVEAASKVTQGEEVSEGIQFSPEYHAHLARIWVSRAIQAAMATQPVG